ncbi:MAG: hypothetical protein ACYCPS_01550 [Candidatus Saccharimonadales bacterium]
MTLKKIGAILVVLIIGLAYLFNSHVQAAGTTLYWCEFSSNSNWNNSTNWNTSSSCSGGTQEVPASGDALVFNNSSLTSSLDLTNDISGLDLASITLEGTGSGAYSLSGDAISLDGGITDTITGPYNDTVSMNISLTASQTFVNNQAGDHLYLGGAINLGTSNLTLATKASQLTVSGSIAGSGTLTLASPPSGSNTAYYILDSADTSFSGPVVINSSAIGEDNSNSFNAFGTGSITVNNGGSLLIESTASTGTLANALNLAGSGISGTGLYAITSCLDNASGCTSANTTLTLPGKITLLANTVLVNGAYTVGESSPPAHQATFYFTGGGVYNGYTLSGLSSSSTSVTDPTPIVAGSGSSSNGVSGSSPNVKAPNTGQGLSIANIYLPIIGAVLIAGSLLLTSFALSKRLNTFRSKK